jgi:Holliday junction resolvase
MESMSADKLELDIQRELVEFLRTRGWHVERMLGNAYQFGIPDLFCYHKKWGMRWVEVKRPSGWSFTLRQRQKWPEWERVGLGIWILTAANQEQYDLLFQPPNWRNFWKSSYAVPTTSDIDAMLDALAQEGAETQT